VQADRLLVVVAHPDDETLGAGGLIASAASVDASVTVVIATDGEASHPDSVTHTPKRIAEIRRAEATAAVFRLHPDAELVFLGLPDSDLAAHADELSEQVARHATEASLLVTPWSEDRHPDHTACAEVAARVAAATGIEHWQFPIWAWHWGTPQSPEFASRSRMRRLRLDEYAAASKLRAIVEYRSQHTALSEQPGDEAILSDAMLAHFRRSYEVFVVGDPAPASTAAYFDDLYEQDRDPWKLADRFYERRKRAILLASLPRGRFRRAFEPGCATGMLTVELARWCDEVVAWDGAPVAVDETTARIRSLQRGDRVGVECARIPDDWPLLEFDLIVLSEVAYYCPDLRELKDRVDQTLAADGVLVACHWRRGAPDHPATAEAVHAALSSGLRNIVSHREADFLLDVWTRDGVSVAEAEGIV
jgi:LmbE family N-acetylglucosaminyl deacetylase